jgi:transcriptional regulator of arginine metabolism
VSSRPLPVSAQRLNSLRELLSAGEISTQEELAEELSRQKFVVTQSTISRDLRRLGAVKTQDSTGRTVYRLPEDVSAPVPLATSGLRNLLVDIEHNGSMIVIHTTPGSASLVASQLDHTRPEGILGTIAGDDTIFVAPANSKRIESTISAIVQQFT